MPCQSRLPLPLLLLVSLSLPLALTLEGSLAPRAEAQAVDFTKLKAGDRVRITLRPDRLIEGDLVEIDQFSITVKTNFGQQELRKGEIVAIEKVRTFESIYEERAAACRTADDWCDLGDWATDEGREREALEAYRQATQVEVDHARARKALNEEKVDGEWLPFAEAQRKKGLVEFDGEWMTPEEAEARERAEEEAVSAEKLKGREQLRREYEGRPWAEIDPIETEHYIIWCNSTPEIADYYADVMEALYKEYDKVFPEKYFPRNSRRKSEVWIHANHQQFMDWTFNGPGTGGFFRPALRDVTAYHGSFGMTGSTEEVLAHEGTHQFEGLIFDNLFALPAWFIEGLAVYFGDGSKIGRRKVEINQIPRDRLVGLQQAIRDGSYCSLEDLLMVPQPAFSGFFYSHGWGIIYWCLWGQEMGAGNKGVGRPIMDDWLMHCKQESKKEQFCDHEENSKKFIQILEQHTRKTVAEWEEEYKEWILSLPVEEIGKRRGNKWSSEPLKLEITKPTGWGWEKDTDLAGSEVVAARGSGGKVRRVSTYCWPNWQKASMSANYAQSLAKSVFEEVPADVEYRVETVGGYPGAIRARLKARRIVKTETIFDEQGNGRTEVTTTDPLEYEIVFYGSIDKIYANVFECDPEIWDANYDSFEKYLDGFKIDN
ncbi:MAG: hypothetical protein ACO4B4_04670 [Planctomycetota bacterium]|jgi:hypothetical protein